MDHNIFKFTMRSEIKDHKEDYKSFMFQNIYDIISELEHRPIEIIDMLTVNYKDDDYLSYSNFLVHDYGVAQVGVNLINSFVLNLFAAMLLSEINLKAIVIHPICNIATGALIKWDDINEELIISDL